MPEAPKHAKVLANTAAVVHPNAGIASLNDAIDYGKLKHVDFVKKSNEAVLKSVQ